MKVSKLTLLFLSVIFLCTTACRKDKPDERIYGRWKISEYYLDDQSAYDTITKYLDSVEYEIWELNAPASSSAGGDVAIKIHGLEGVPPIRFEDVDKSGFSLLFSNTIIPPPYCNPQSTSKGCFECSDVWIYTFLNDNTMEWRPSNGNNHPIIHQHRLVFTRIN